MSHSFFFLEPVGIAEIFSIVTVLAEAIISLYDCYILLIIRRQVIIGDFNVVHYRKNSSVQR